jgi:release factor glutamine methyltransferase
MNTTLGTILREAVHCLTQHGTPEPCPAAEVLLADLLVLPRSHLYLAANTPLSAAQHRLYKERIQRRLRGEPVPYITGRQEFWSLEFEVNPQVLIPRPESELLVEYGMRLAQQWCKAYGQLPLYMLDVGTGSGNLAISLAHVFPQSMVWGIDVAMGALYVAQRNARRLGVAERLTWVCGDLVTPLQAEARRFALCVSNLPYVTTGEWQHLPRQIRDYEPPGALLGGQDGLDLIRRLIVASPGVLASGGGLFLEVGWQQATAVIDIIQQSGQFRDSGVYRDFAEIERVVWARVP